METRFVVRATEHIEEDLKRNWSAPLGGSFHGDFCDRYFDSPEDAAEAYNKYFWSEEYKANMFAFHPAYNTFVQIHYYGLGAWEIEGAATMEEAEQLLRENHGGYYNNPEMLACTDGKGDGHFYAEDVVRYKEIKEGLFLIEVKV